MQNAVESPSRVDSPGRTRENSLVAGLALSLAALAFASPPAIAAGPERELPLGSAGLEETRESRTVAAGVRYTRIVRGKASVRDAYTVDIAFRSDPREARELARRLRSDGYPARVLVVSERAPDDPAPGPLGRLVRVGTFETEAEATALRDELSATGLTGLRVVFTPEDGRPTDGPWVVHVLDVDPERLTGRIDARLATDVVPGRELLSALAGRSASFAALNGGYFVIGEADGTPGDLAGISVLDGNLVSEAVAGRTSLLLPTPSGADAQVAALSTRVSALSSDGAQREVDGLNRKPGLIRGCGGTGGDTPTEAAKHDFTCRDASELIHHTPAFGSATDTGAGAEAVLDASGRVVELRASRGGAIPPDGSVLSGTGDAAEWLSAHGSVGMSIAVSNQILAGNRPVAVRPSLDVVNGGPRLLRGGRPAITAFAEGFHWTDNPEFYYRFGIRRNPRTLAGVTEAGRLVLVAVEGRKPGSSVGASFRESARLMRALGAEDAVNLDGGGSTGMTLGSALVTRPSDLTGERPIADGLVLSPIG